MWCIEDGLLFSKKELCLLQFHFSLSTMYNSCIALSFHAHLSTKPPSPPTWPSSFKNFSICDTFFHLKRNLDFQIFSLAQHFFQSLDYKAILVCFLKVFSQTSSTPPPPSPLLSPFFKVWYFVEFYYETIKLCGGDIDIPTLAVK